MGVRLRSHGISSCLVLAVSLNLYFVPVARTLRIPDSPDLAQTIPNIPGIWTAARASSLRTAAETLLLEAAGEGIDGMTAVGEVIRNRARLFGMNVRDVCLKPYQFSGWNDRAEARAFLKNHRRYYAFAVEAWRRSASSDLTHGATEYHASSIQPWWSKYYSESARIGRHVFYRRES